MRLVFAGTPDFSVPALDALAAAGHEIVAVFTQPDRPAGRGRVLTPTAIATRAAALGLPAHKPAKLDACALAELECLAPDALVVVAYGLILPAEALSAPRHGAFNIHASLLPRWRGAAPIQRAILAGDAATGVTIMRMDAGLDTGPMLLQERVAIAPDMTAGELHDALAPVGARLMVEALGALAAGALHETPQPADGVTYAKKITKDEARLDWSRPATELARCVRAYNPAPGAWTELAGERVRVLRAREDRAAGAPRNTAPAGTVIAQDEHEIHVATGDGVLGIEALQWPGGRVLSAREAMGRSLSGKKFG
jgi:methionyl-tRNA formyltransferase